VIAKCVRFVRTKFISGAAQVCDPTALIDRHRHDLDSVPIRGFPVCNVALRDFNWKELSDLAVENIEEAGNSVRSKRSEKKPYPQ